MNIKTMRIVHLFLGCFFAPVLLFFVVSGAWQVLDLHQSRKDGHYVAPRTLASLSDVHRHQRWQSGRDVPPSRPFQFFVLVMSIGFVVTTVLGIIMALKMTRPLIVWSLLLGGILVPVIFLWMFSSVK